MRGGGGGIKSTPAVLGAAGVDTTVPGYCFNFDCATFLLAAVFDFAFLAFAGLFFDVDAEADAVFPELLAFSGSSRFRLFFLPQPS